MIFSQISRAKPDPLKKSSLKSNVLLRIFSQIFILDFKIFTENFTKNALEYLAFRKDF